MAKRSRVDDADGKLDIILERVEQVHTRVGVLEDHLQFIMFMKDIFDCVVCKGTTKSPMFATCCQRVIGCEQCVERWVSSNKSCPHCSTDTATHRFMKVRGFDEVLSMSTLY